MKLPIRTKMPFFLIFRDISIFSHLILKIEMGIPLINYPYLLVVSRSCHLHVKFYNILPNYAATTSKNCLKRCNNLHFLNYSSNLFLNHCCHKMKQEFILNIVAFIVQIHVHTVNIL